jgi:hypothetical protein
MGVLLMAGHRVGRDNEMETLHTQSTSARWKRRSIDVWAARVTHPAPERPPRPCDQKPSAPRVRTPDCDLPFRPDCPPHASHARSSA